MPSFWSSTPGRKAVTALNNIQPKDDQDKENVPHDVTDRETSAGKRTRGESCQPDKNRWRRSIMPLPGQKRTGRLKRVGRIYSHKEEEGEKEVRIPLAARDGNRLGGRRK